MPKYLSIATACIALTIAQSAHADLRLGVGASITGPNAAFGAQLKTGVEQAVADLNERGGIAGQRVKIIYGDDQADPRQGVSVANKLVAEGVFAVIGHVNSGVSIPASEVYSDAGVLQITPMSTNPTYTERDLWNTFRTCGRDDQQGTVAGQFMLSKFKGEKIAIVHDKTPYGKGLADRAKKVMEEGGLRPVVYEGINPGEKDYSALVSKLKLSGIGAVYYGGYYTEAGLILRQMRDQALQASLVSGDAMASNDFAAIAGPAVVGTYFTSATDQRSNPNAKSTVERILAKGQNPESFTLYAYAAVQVLEQASLLAKSTEGKKIAASMKSGHKSETVIGKISFDSKGDVSNPAFDVFAWGRGSDNSISYRSLAGNPQ